MQAIKYSRDKPVPLNHSPVRQHAQQAVCRAGAQQHLKLKEAGHVLVTVC